MFAAIWAFLVEPERAEEFERAYGPLGDWSRLFSTSEAYRGTELLADEGRPGRYLTIDRWDSQEDHDRFLVEHLEAYERLDASLEHLTERETPIGRFTVMPQV